MPEIIEFYLCIQMLPSKMYWPHFSWPTLYIEVHARLLLPVLHTIELSVRCQMCDLHFKFLVDQTKTAVAIVVLRTDRHRHTDRHVLSHCIICPMPCIALETPTVTLRR